MAISAFQAKNLDFRPTATRVRQLRMFISRELPVHNMRPAASNQNEPNANRRGWMLMSWRGRTRPGPGPRAGSTPLHLASPIRLGILFAALNLMVAACGQPATEQSPSQSTAPRSDRVDPATFPAKFDTEVRRVLRGQLPDSAASRIEPTLGGGGRMRRQDYNYTDAWTAWYHLAPTNLFMVILQHDPSANEGDPARYCRESLATHRSEECSARKLPNETTAITQTYRL